MAIQPITTTTTISTSTTAPAAAEVRPATRDATAISYIERYMQTLYPCDSVFAMVGAVAPATHREFSFVKSTPAGAEPERWSRNLSFSTPAAFKQALRTREPFRIEIGGAWTVEPQLRKAFLPDSGRVAARNLVFDIDIDDYDQGNKRGLPRARSCCTRAAWCQRCWPILATGCSMIDVALDEMGAKGVGWFFSGRRGMHCWVLDPVLATADQTEREALRWLIAPDTTTDIMTGAFDGSELCARVLATVIETRRTAARPSPSRNRFFGWYVQRQPLCALSAIEAALSRHPKLQDGAALTSAVKAGLGAAADADAALGTAPAGSTVADIGGKAAETVLRAFDAIAAVVKSANDPLDGGRFESAASVVVEAALTCLMPRIDEPVTVQPNHLVRSPMCVHADTMRLGVLVPRGRLLSFLPSEAPVLVGERGGKQAWGSDGRPTTEVICPAFDNDSAVRLRIDEFRAWVASVSGRRAV